MKADKKSRGTHPITENKIALDIHAEYSEAEYEKISEGFQPYDMDQKWFIYMEDDTLWFHRSWTGECIFEARLAKEGGKYAIKEAFVDGVKNLDDPKVLAYWSKIMLFLINVILLGKNDSPPELDEHADNPAESFAFRFHMFGHQGVSQLELDAVAEFMKEIREKKE
jgi:hypothetical protein